MRKIILIGSILWLVGMAFSSSAQENAAIHLTLQQVLPKQYVDDVAWSHDGRYLAIMDRDGLVTVMKSLSWETVKTLDCGNGGGERLVWSPKKLILAISCRNMTNFMAQEILENQLIINRFGIGNQRISWSEDGTWLIIPQSDGNINILSSSYQLIDRLGYLFEPDDLHPGGYLNNVNYTDFWWSPNKNYLASLSLRILSEISIWDVQSNQVIHEIEHGFKFRWLPDESGFVVVVQDIGKEEGSIQHWRLSPLEMVSSSPIPYQLPIFFDGSPNDAYMAYCAPDDKLLLYNLETAQFYDLISDTDYDLHCPVYNISWSSTDFLAIAEQDHVSIWLVEE